MQKGTKSNTSLYDKVRSKSAVDNSSQGRLTIPPESHIAKKHVLDDFNALNGG